jgi:hypothetical protein
MAITVIRHENRIINGEQYIAQVTTNLVPFTAVYQTYKVFANGCLNLDVEETYSTEIAAIQRFNKGL